MKKVIRWGIVGPGNIANKFAKAVKNFEGAELVAVDRRTMKRDLTQLQVIPYQTSEKSGRMRILGKDLIHYRTYVR